MRAWLTLESGELLLLGAITSLGFGEVHQASWVLADVYFLSWATVLWVLVLYMIHFILKFEKKRVTYKKYYIMNIRVFLIKFIYGISRDCVILPHNNPLMHKMSYFFFSPKGYSPHPPQFRCWSQRHHWQLWCQLVSSALIYTRSFRKDQ